MKDIRTRYLPDAEAERLYANHPSLGRSYTQWCPTCDKKGTYTWRGKVYECDCEEQLQLHKWYLASGIGVTYQRLDWGDYTGPDSTRVNVFKYLDRHEQFIKRGMGLYFVGPYGTGKTMLANLILKEMVKYGYTCWATTFADMVTMFTAGWGDRVEQEYFQTKFIGSQILLLDDVGKELNNTSLKLAETTFDSVLRQRVQNGRVTILTTNLEPIELERDYGSAILSLLREKSLELSFKGDDFRNSAREREVDEVFRGETRPIV